MGRLSYEVYGEGWAYSAITFSLDEAQARKFGLDVDRPAVWFGSCPFPHDGLIHLLLAGILCDPDLTAFSCGGHGPAQGLMAIERV
ncbi:hypothetical protein D3C71_98360 [compost metagenome]